MKAAESPDVLEDGRWVNERGVMRWVADPTPIRKPQPVIRCADCGIEVERTYCRGKCRHCYDLPRFKTNRRNRRNADLIADWEELHAQGMSIREATEALGLSRTALYTAISRARQSGRVEKARERAGKVA